MKTVQFLLVHKVSGSWCCRADTALKLYTNMFQVCDGGSHVSRKAAEQDMQTLFVQLQFISFSKEYLGVLVSNNTPGKCKQHFCCDK